MKAASFQEILTSRNRKITTAVIMLTSQIVRHPFSKEER